MRQTIAKAMAVAIIVTLMVTFILAGTQCAAEKPPEPSAEGTVVVAAKDSPIDLKVKADYICDGVNDDETIQAAIDEVQERGGGQVVLLEGTFLLNYVIYVKSHVTLKGQGYDTLLTPAIGIPSMIRVKLATDVVVSDLRSDANGNAAYAVDVVDSSKRVTVENVWAFNAGDDEISVVHGSEDIIIRNCTIKGRVGGASRANIEIGDESKRVTVSNNTLLGGHEDRMGISANFHPDQWGAPKDLDIIGNTIEDVSTDGMRLAADRVTVSENTLSNIGGHGIKILGDGGSIITNNRMSNVGGAGIYVADRQKVTVTGNQLEEAGGIIVGWGPPSALVDDNLVRGSEGDGILINGGNNITVSNNTLENNTDGLSINAPATKVTIVNNRVSSSGYGLTLGRLAKTTEIINGVVIKDNDFDDNSAGWLLLAAVIKNLEVEPPYADSIVDCFSTFRGVLPASTNYVHQAIAGSRAEQEITTGITNPDFPRNISITATNNEAPSGSVKVDGTNARGNADSEEITIIGGGTAYSNKAFAAIARITIPAGVSQADAVEIGISDKLGLSHPISAATDVYKVEGRPENWLRPVDVANGTINLARIPTNPDPNFPNFRVWYKARLTSD